MDILIALLLGLLGVLTLTALFYFRDKIIKNWKKIFAVVAGGSLIIGGGMLLLPDAPPSADTGWWIDTNWEYVKKITFNADPYISVNLANFPMLVDISSNTDLADNAQSNGNDTLFTADNQTKLSHEIEYWNDDGTYVNASIWVNVTSVSSIADTIIWMYYGNLSAVNQEDITGTWNSGYVGVWHLGEGDSTAADFYKDSTISDNDGTLVDGDGDSIQADGQIGYCMHFNSDADFINLGNDLAELETLVFTAEYWFDIDWPFSTYRGILQVADTSATHGHCSGIQASEEHFAYLYKTITDYIGVDTAITDGFHYSAYDYDGVDTGHKYYEDALTDTDSGLLDDLDYLGTTICAIGKYDAGSIKYFDGLIDEVRISNVVRNASWLNTSFHTANLTTGFLTVGSEIEESDWWNTDWDYRKTVDLCNAVTDYQVKIIVGNNTGVGDINCSGNLGLANFTDIRFTDTATDLELYHWMENHTADTQATFWVNISSANNITLYYGNSNAVNTSYKNGTLTFIFFDDFNDGVIDTDKWDVETGTPTETGGNLLLEGTERVYTDDNWGAFNLRFKDRIYITEADSALLGINEHNDGTGTDYIYVYDTDHAGNKFPEKFACKSEENNNQEKHENLDFSDTDSYNTYEILWMDSGVNTKIYQNDDLATTVTTRIPDGACYIRLNVWDSGQASSLYCDWVFASLYAVTEPTFCNLSAEETRWWDSDWTYRKNADICNVIADYQIRLIVGNNTDVGDINCSGNLGMANFTDIRFIETDGYSHTELYHWMENYTSNVQATFWVNISDATNIYMYYGNSNAVNTSFKNGYNTFIEFDDFEDGSTTDAGDLWDTTGELISTDYAHWGTYSMFHDADVWIESKSLGYDLNTTKYGFFLRMAGSGASYGRFATVDDSGDDWGTFTQFYNNEYRYHNGVEWIDTGITIDTNKFYKLEWMAGATTFNSTCHTTVNESLSNRETITEVEHYKMNGGASSSPGSYFDDFYVAMFSSPEPTFCNWDDEESQEEEEEEGWSNTAPTITASSENPPDTQTGVDLSLTNYYDHFNITVADVNEANQSINVTWRTNESGTWTDMGQNASATCNSTFYCTNVSWVDTYSTKYWWSVNVSDNYTTQGWVNATYDFTTIDYTPDFPTGVTTSAGEDWINISWTNGASKVDTTLLEVQNNSMCRGTYAMGEGEVLQNTSADYFNYTGLISGRRYFFQLWSYNDTGKVYSTVVEANDITLFIGDYCWWLTGDTENDLEYWNNHLTYAGGVWSGEMIDTQVKWINFTTHMPDSLDDGSGDPKATLLARINATWTTAIGKPYPFDLALSDRDVHYFPGNHDYSGSYPLSTCFGPATATYNQDSWQNSTESVGAEWNYSVDRGNLRYIYAGPIAADSTSTEKQIELNATMDWIRSEVYDAYNKSMNVIWLANSPIMNGSEYMYYQAPWYSYVNYITYWNTSTGWNDMPINEDVTLDGTYDYHLAGGFADPWIGAGDSTTDEWDEWMINRSDEFWDIFGQAWNSVSIFIGGNMHQDPDNNGGMDNQGPWSTNSSYDMYAWDSYNGTGGKQIHKTPDVLFMDDLHAGAWSDANDEYTRVILFKEGSRDILIRIFCHELNNAEIATYGTNTDFFLMTKIY